MDKLTEIRKRLKSITPGQWHTSKFFAPLLPGIGVFSDVDLIASLHPSERYEDHAHFISRAPDDMRYLLDEVERLQKVEARARLLIGGIAMSLPPQKRAELEALSREVFGDNEHDNS